MGCGFCQRVRQIFRGPQIDPGNVGFDERPGTFHLSYGHVRQPGPGVGYHTYQSLALMEYPPSGPTVTTRKPIIPFFPQMVIGFGLRTQGIPLVAGQVFGVPLYDPSQGGYASDPIGAQISPLVDMNIPVHGPDNPNKLTLNPTNRVRVRPGP